jgi:hypothetical protein
MGFAGKGAPTLAAAAGRVKEGTGGVADGKWEMTNEEGA